MLAFIVPVKSKKVTTDWEIFSKLVERTLRSVTNQTSDEYFVIVVCHERPVIHFEHPKVIFHSVEFDPPIINSENYQYRSDLREADKSRKILEALQFPRVADSDFVMVVDSDDLISNQLAEFVSKSKGDSDVGWYARSGFLFWERSKFLLLLWKEFHLRCGTCQIIRPDLLSKQFDTNEGLFFDHKNIEITPGQSLKSLPFSGVIYSMANGENMYMSEEQIRTLNKITGKLIGVFHWITRKSVKYFPYFITSRIRKEFGLYRI